MQPAVLPEELLEAATFRIDTHYPTLNAVVTPMCDEVWAAIDSGFRDRQDLNVLF
jgi:hypothetical protein